MVLSACSLKKKEKGAEAGLLLCFGGDLPTVICCQGACRENMRFPAALWPSATENNYTFPLNTPKLSEFQRKCSLPSQDSVVREMANL